MEERKGPLAGLGVLLYRFLDLFGRTFDYSSNAVAVGGGQGVVSQGSLGLLEEVYGMRLLLQCPLSGVPLLPAAAAGSSHLCWLLLLPLARCALAAICQRCCCSALCLSPAGCCCRCAAAGVPGTARLPVWQLLSAAAPSHAMHNGCAACGGMAYLCLVVKESMLMQPGVSCWL